jgi:hypothetical protein
MYRQHVNEKEARSCQKVMMHHLGMTDVKSGSKDNITPEEKWWSRTSRVFSGPTEISLCQWMIWTPVLLMA